MQKNQTCRGGLAENFRFWKKGRKFRTRGARETNIFSIFFPRKSRDLDELSRFRTSLGWFNLFLGGRSGSEILASSTHIASGRFGNSRNLKRGHAKKFRINFIIGQKFRIFRQRPSTSATLLYIVILLIHTFSMGIMIFATFRGTQTMNVS